jgi:hypothetical protein
MLFLSADNMENLEKLLAQATGDELVSLSRLLDAPNGTILGIAEAFQRNATSAWGYHVREKRPSYGRIVKDLALRLLPQDANADSVAIEETEARIVKHIWKTVWEKMSPDSVRCLTAGSLRKPNDGVTARLRLRFLAQEAGCCWRRRRDSAFTCLHRPCSGR